MHVLRRPTPSCVVFAMMDTYTQLCRSASSTRLQTVHKSCAVAYTQERIRAPVMQPSSSSLAAPSDALVTSLRASASELAMLDTALACVAAFCAIMSLAAILNAVKNTREAIHTPQAVFSRLKAPIITCAVSSILSIVLYCICHAGDIEDTMLTVALVASIISLLVVVIAMAILGFSVERGEQQYNADNTDDTDTSNASNPVPTTTFDDTTTPTDNMSENTNTYPVSHTTSNTASFNTDAHDTTNVYTNNDADNIPTIS